MYNGNDSASDAFGNLKDASKINFYFDKDSSQPMSGPDTVPGPRRSVRDRKVDKFTAALAEEQAPAPAKRTSTSKPRRKRARKNPSTDHPSDDEGSDFEDGDVLSSDDDSILEISNEELADSLPAKVVVPASKKRKASSQAKRIEIVDKESAEQAALRFKSPDAHALDLADGTAVEKARMKARSTIHLFFEDKVDDPLTGDKIFRCRHGRRTAVTIPKTSRGNLDKLVRHLKNMSTPMYRLYTILKQRSGPVTQEEINIAKGLVTLPHGALNDYLAKMENVSENLRLALERQALKSEPWDQDRWEGLIAEFFTACDQPFETVERPEFVKLLEYAHHPSTTPLHIPGRKAIRTRIMKMGEDIVESTRQMFEALESKISISLNCWTSSNQHAFLAIIAHWINNDGEADELLIDFRELQGSHTGKNMAEAVWKTLTIYGIERKDSSYTARIQHHQTSKLFIKVISERLLSLNFLA